MNAINISTVLHTGLSSCHVTALERLLIVLSRTFDGPNALSASSSALRALTNGSSPNRLRDLIAHVTDLIASALLTSGSAGRQHANANGVLAAVTRILLVLPEDLDIQVTYCTLHILYCIVDVLFA